MNADEIYGDTTHLAELIRVRAPTSSQLEAELRLVLDAIHQQVRIASTLALQWDHIKKDNAFQLAPPAEQILVTSRCLRTAEVTKERVLRLGTRYILTDLVYENHSFTGRISRFDRQDWLMEDHKLEVRSNIVLQLINRQKRLLEREIREMEAFLGRQEKALNDEYARVDDRVSTVLKREFELLHDQLDGRSNEQVGVLIDMLTAQKEEMQQLKQTIQRMEESSNRAAPKDEFPVKVNASRTQRSLSGERVHFAADDHSRDEEDEDYWSRMVNEVSDPSNDDEPAVKPRRVHDDSPRIPSIFDRVNQLEDEITQMERDLEYFPFRDPGDRCAGLQTTMRCAFCDAEEEHFSNACPVFRSGDERSDIIRAKGWCTFCIGDCPRNVPCRL
ncbi:hypothetical protein ANCDUO_13027 [Ancylostoma duodenale]|uniref:Uncharacterized protein n=1 Tax=Ancylostoma duodenale TaxID=51022 RepID=A0A0C2GD24_9BILA|nr:hypothetical protein ANCDUO_13027 [Ancylostoma duodenale]